MTTNAQKTSMKWLDTNPSGSRQTLGNSDRYSIDLERGLPRDVPVEARKELTFLTLQNCKRILYAAVAVTTLITIISYGNHTKQHRRLYPQKARNELRKQLKRNNIAGGFRKFEDTYLAEFDAEFTKVALRKLPALVEKFIKEKVDKKKVEKCIEKNVPRKAPCLKKDDTLRTVENDQPDGAELREVSACDEVELYEGVGGNFHTQYKKGAETSNVGKTVEVQGCGLMKWMKPGMWFRATIVDYNHHKNTKKPYMVRLHNTDGIPERLRGMKKFVLTSNLRTPIAKQTP